MIWRAFPFFVNYVAAVFFWCINGATGSVSDHAARFGVHDKLYYRNIVVGLIIFVLLLILTSNFSKPDHQNLNY